MSGSLVVSMSNARTMQSGLSIRSSRFTTSGSSDAPLTKNISFNINQSRKREVTFSKGDGSYEVPILKNYVRSSNQFPVFRIRLMMPCKSCKAEGLMPSRCLAILRVSNHVWVTTMKRLDQGHLHPKLEVPGLMFGT